MTAPSTMQWIRQAAQRIATGSARLATNLASRALHAALQVWRRATGWLGEASGISWLLRLAVLIAATALLRKIITAVAAAVYARVESGAAPWLMWGVAVLWLVAAYRCGREDWEPSRPASKEPADGEQLAGGANAEPDVAQSPAGPPPVSPVALIAAVRDIGTPHAQLKPIAEHLSTTTDVVRAAAAGMGWPVKDVRMQGRSASAGLRWDECPSPAPIIPSPGVVGAGQAADDNDDDDSDGQGPQKGIAVRRTDGGLVIYDLADTHRRRGIVGR
ncbi:hypothetical protein ACFUVV_01095 [Streptomyces sp. NPDC057376]|uniref:hypothetical protein n=1 Tax=unclassified Streptomyces TaxID=2593676 RepID=UPI0023493E5B|nr:hypothetical protein [Streptomyces sp. M92]WCN06050.1 hypothetical protein M6G08_30410 [Streptomyces sp. M92]